MAGNALPDCPGLWEFVHHDGRREAIRIVEREHLATGERALFPITEFMDVELEEMRQAGRFSRYLGPPTP